MSIWAPRSLCGLSSIGMCSFTRIRSAQAPLPPVLLLSLSSPCESAVICLFLVSLFPSFRLCVSASGSSSVLSCWLYLPLFVFLQLPHSLTVSLNLWSLVFPELGNLGWEPSALFQDLSMCEVYSSPSLFVER
ncbi:unnamed protein product [Gulo gulo]|uniref:Uncharacterized protein n=1 Tax=Gulo gulo TaxID=48420 RepID=A0A9X9MBR4_GULGU|nr:unnamed protein product [Gulo gulo]